MDTRKDPKAASKARKPQAKVQKAKAPKAKAPKVEVPEIVEVPETEEAIEAEIEFLEADLDSFWDDTKGDIPLRGDGTPAREPIRNPGHLGTHFGRLEDQR